MPEGKSPARDDSLEGLVGALRKAASEVNALPTTAVAAKGSVSAAAGMRALIDLKRVGRDQHLALAEHKEATGEIKGKLARAHLYLQSLQYQKSYYHKEIASCREFVSAFSDAQIGLSDEPAAAVGGRATGVTPHAIMLKRLAHENQERKRLCEAQETLRTREKELEEHVSGKRKQLLGLSAQLVNVRKATAPLQKHLGVAVREQTKQKALAKLLPAPLYILYSQLVAVMEAFAAPIQVEIIGRVSEAEAFVARAARDAAAAGAVSAAAAEEAATEEEERASKRSKRMRGGAHEASTENKLMEVSLHFTYLTNLHVVCAGSSHADTTLLVNLFPADSGLASPNSANTLLATELSFDKAPARPYAWAQQLAGLDFLPIVPPTMPGQVSGAAAAAAAVVAEAVSAQYRGQSRVASVLEAVRARCAARKQLKKQLEGLRNLQPWREAIPGTLLQLLPSVRCKLGEWREATQSMMEATQSTVTTAAGGEEDGEEGAVGGEAVEDVEMEDTGADEASELEEAEAGAAAEEEEARNAAAGRRVFEARVMGAANGLQLLVTVEISSEYPVRPPSFRLRLNSSPKPPMLPADGPTASGPPARAHKLSGAEAAAAYVANDLRAMERELNVECVHKLGAPAHNGVLSFQVLWLLYRVDMYSKSEPWLGGTTSQHPGGRTCRGRERIKPL